MWFVVFLVSLAAFVALCLCIPIELVFYVNTATRPKIRLRLVWFFGLISKELRHSEEKPKKKAISEHDTRIDDWLQRIKFPLDILQTKGLFRRVIIFVKKIVKCFHVKELAANLKVDLDNPADTGRLFAVLAPLNLAITYFLPYPVKIEPSFTGETIIAGYLNGAIKLIPIQIAASFIWFAFSLPFLRVAKKLIVFRWKTRR